MPPSRTDSTTPSGVTYIMQRKLGSFIEAWGNTVVGFGINFTANWFLLPLVGAKLTLGTNFLLGLAYTLISVARQYVIRRYFNGLKAGWNVESKVGKEVGPVPVRAGGVSSEVSGSAGG